MQLCPLVLPQAEMERRNQQRMAHEGYADQSPWFERMLAYQIALQASGLVDATVDVNRALEDVVGELLQLMECRVA